MPAKKDFVPDSWKNLRDWALNIIANFSSQIQAVEGWHNAAPRISAFLARIAAIHDAAQAVLDAETALETKVGALQQVLDVQLPEVRTDIANMKKSRGWNEGKSDALDVATPPASLDPNTLQPRLEVTEKAGRNVIMVKKLGVDSVNVRVRKKGTAAFTPLANKRVRFPMDDDTASADGKPEDREYQVTAVIDDDEVGEPSAIVPATWRA